MRSAVLLAVGSAPDLAAALDPAPPAELVVLGSGGPRMVGRAASSNAIVLDGKARILVDAGSGAAVRLGEAGLDIEDLDTILLTHLHIDHSGDLPGVAKARGMIHQGPMTFRVFGPAGRGPQHHPIRRPPLRSGRHSTPTSARSGPRSISR